MRYQKDTLFLRKIGRYEANPGADGRQKPCTESPNHYGTLDRQADFVLRKPCEMLLE